MYLHKIGKVVCKECKRSASIDDFLVGDREFLVEPKLEIPVGHSIQGVGHPIVQPEASIFFQCTLRRILTTRTNMLYNIVCFVIASQWFFRIIFVKEVFQAS